MPIAGRSKCLSVAENIAKAHYQECIWKPFDGEVDQWRAGVRECVEEAGEFWDEFNSLCRETKGCYRYNEICSNGTCCSAGQVGCDNGVCLTCESHLAPNPRTCECDCVPYSCPEPQAFDQDLCRCACPGVTCLAPLIQDLETCECIEDPATDHNLDSGLDLRSVLPFESELPEGFQVIGEGTYQSRDVASGMTPGWGIQGAPVIEEDIAAGEALLARIGWQAAVWRHFAGSDGMIIITSAHAFANAAGAEQGYRAYMAAFETSVGNVFGAIAEVPGAFGIITRFSGVDYLSAITYARVGQLVLRVAVAKAPYDDPLPIAVAVLRVMVEKSMP